MERHALAAGRGAPQAPHAGPRSLVITSGKGGVGKSHIALNVAVQLAKSGLSVCLLDANPGPGNLELLCGLNGYWNLKHVLAGSRSVADVAMAGPHDLTLLTGAAELLGSPIRTPTAAHCRAWSQVVEFLQPFQYVIIDTASSEQALNRRLMQAADCTWLVTTPELTAIADAYCVIKGCAAAGQLPLIEIIVNRAASGTQARDIVERLQHTTRSFLQQEVHQAGYIPHDLCVADAVQQRQPFVLHAPQSPAAQSIEQLARQWKQRRAVTSATFSDRFTEDIKRAA